MTNTKHIPGRGYVAQCQDCGRTYCTAKDKPGNAVQAALDDEGHSYWNHRDGRLVCFACLQVPLFPRAVRGNT